VVKAPALGAYLLLIADEVARAIPAVELALGDRAREVTDAVSDGVRIAALVTRSTTECFLCTANLSCTRRESSPDLAGWHTRVRFREPVAGTRRCILDLRKVAADAADRIELRYCIAWPTRADSLGFVSARALARFLVLAGPVYKIAIVPTNGFARI
jgi:hypothetical protein